MPKKSSAKPAQPAITFDDMGDDLASDLGILPSAPKPIEPPAYAEFDATATLALPPRDQFAAFTKVLAELEADEKATAARIRAAYHAELEEVWRKVSPRGKKPFKPEVAEKDLGDAARSLAERHILVIKASEPAFLKARDRLADLIRLAADEIAIEPSEADYWFYSQHYTSTYSTQTNPLTYAKAFAELTAANVRHSGIKAEVREHGTAEKLPYFGVYVWCAEKELPVLRKKTGAPFPQLVKLSWKLGANPRVFWPFLPHGYEEKHGFNQFGDDIPTKVHTAEATVTHTAHGTETAQISEAEPEVI